jgi:hypothetical protein
MKTKTVEIEGRTFVIGKLCLDDVEEFEQIDKGPHPSLTSLHAAARKTCERALAHGGVTDPSEVGKLDLDDLTVLTAYVVIHAGMVTVPVGEVVRSLLIGQPSAGSSPESSTSSLPS